MIEQPSSQQKEPRSPTRFSTGIGGLDIILHGGVIQAGCYLVQGDPGSGKTTLGLQYLLEQAKTGARVLYIAMTESRQDMEMICASHGWSPEKVELFALEQPSSSLLEQTQRSIFDPAETQLGDLIQAVVAQIDRVKPSHIVFDGLSELRLLSGSQLRYRRQVLSLKNFLAERGITTMLLDDRTGNHEISSHQSVVGGIIVLETSLPQYGRGRRRLYIGKVRSSDFKEGYHDYDITAGGLVVFPRLVGLERIESVERRLQTSGVTNLDKMFQGGLITGASSVFIGPSGVGKSTVAMQFVGTALRQGFKAAVYTFDEVLATFIERSEKLILKSPGALRPYLEDGRLIARQIDPAELTPGAFAESVRIAVDRGASIIVIDSLNGYLNSMPEERFLSTHLHELVSYLNQRDVITIMVVAQHGVLRGSSPDFNVSYLADSVLLFRYFEAGGELLRAVTTFKNRTGPHENTMRQLIITENGIEVGEPITGLRQMPIEALCDDVATVDSSLCEDFIRQ